MAETVLDKVISYFSPSAALEREIARYQRKEVKNFLSFGAYECGNPSRSRKQAAYHRSQMTDEDSASNGSLERMRLEAMDEYRNSPLARGIVETTRRYCRASTPRANTAAYVDESQKDAAKAWDKRATDYFNSYWSPRMDYTRRPGVDFNTMQDFFITQQFLQGDCAFVGTGDGFIMVEGLQIRTPNEFRSDNKVKHGFRFDSSGRMTHMYWHEWGYNAPWHRVNMASVIFCPWYWRPSSIRSVPRLHGVIDSIRDHEEIHDFVKMKVKHEASLLSIERSGSRKSIGGAKIIGDDGTVTAYEKSDWGMRFKTSGKPGEDFQIASGNAPNAQYVPLMEYDTQLISAGIGIPFKALMSLFDGSWSSNKAVQTALKVYVTELWEHRKKLFCQRVWNVAIAQGIQLGVIPAAPVDANGFSLFNRTEWTRPYFPQLDQQKEEAGRSSAFKNMTQSVEDWADEQGTTAEMLFERHKANVERMKADAESLGMTLKEYSGNLANTSDPIAEKERLGVAQPTEGQSDGN